MKIFIAGASGLIGSNCLRVFNGTHCIVTGSHYSYPTPETVAFNTLQPDHPDNFDIRNFKPDVILHCGALTHVDYCESHDQESFEKTVSSTRNLILLANSLNAKLIYISTDYVFDGLAGPYTEDAPAAPLSVYARHKLMAEEDVLRKAKNSLVVRVTNVYGHELRNKNFVMRLSDIITSGVVTTLRLPFDQFATPINALDVARAIWLLIQNDMSGIYHLASTDFMNRVQLAQRTSDRLSGANFLKIVPKATEELGQPAPRPLRGGLIASKFLNAFPDFRFSNLDDFLTSLKQRI